MNRQLLKNIGIYAAIVAFFIILAYGFMPQLLKGKIVNQSDISGWRGMAQETLEWNKEHPDDKALWSDSMFGGMPTVTTVDDFEGDWTKPLYKLMLWGKRPASYIFIALLGAFLLMLSMGVNRFLAVAGAIAVAFCSYNFQIIQVGHNTKMQAIAFAPWVLAALIFTYRSAFKDDDSPREGVKKWVPMTVLGSILFAIALSFQIKANHVQITYYLALVILIYGIATLVWALKKANRHYMPRFLTASLLLVVMGLVGIGTNANKLLPTAAYAPFTMRGGSELTADGANSEGLNLDYATAWSYGIEETPNLLIPNYNGGSSTGKLGQKSSTYPTISKWSREQYLAMYNEQYYNAYGKPLPKEYYGEVEKMAKEYAGEFCSNAPLYWGPQPFTAGPMYMGAISIFLFILGLCIIRDHRKWWLLVCCILAILLAWGNHFMWFTRLWFDYAPMYNKFRTVSMALVVLQFCIPLLGILALDRIIKTEVPARSNVRAIWIAFGITAGFCLISAVFQSITGSFSSESDESFGKAIADSLKADRMHLLIIDALRSFLLIHGAAGALLWAHLKSDPVKAGRRLKAAAVVISVLVLADMWTIGKRYLNEEHFITPRDFSGQFRESVADKTILKDKDPSYRVLDLSNNTFNSSVASYRHRSIGGYSPTKMQRYDDLIKYYLGGECKMFSKYYGQYPSDSLTRYMTVTSMLNGKYIIKDGQVTVNPYAYGSAWTVSGVAAAATADEEISLLGEVDLKTTAVVREEDAASHPEANVSAGNEAIANGGEVVMTYYSPNELKYHYNLEKESLVVFSEIFHPSWKASCNDNDLRLFRADWVLRAAVIPAGEGEIVMRYEPEDYVKGRKLSVASNCLLVIMLLGSLGLIFVENRKRKKI